MCHSFSGLVSPFMNGGQPETPGSAFLLVDETLHYAMGLLASHLPLDASFEREYVFPLLLDAGCSVYDLMSLALTCTGASLFVRDCVFSLSQPRLNQLLLSCDGRMSPTDKTLRNRLRSFKVGDLMWEVSPSRDPFTVRIVRPETPPTLPGRWSAYTAYGTILAFAVSEVEPSTRPSWNRYFPQFHSHWFQWFPLLDDALYAAIRRLEAGRAMPGVGEKWEQARKRLRTACIHS